MEIKDQETFIQKLQSIHPVAEDRFKEQLKSSILLKTREAADSQNLWELLKNYFKFINDPNMKFQTSLKFAVAAVTFFSFTAIGVYAAPTIHKIVSCEINNGENCFEFEVFECETDNEDKCFKTGDVIATYEDGNNVNHLSVVGEDVNSDNMVEVLQEVKLVGNVDLHPNMMMEVKKLDQLVQTDREIAYVDHSSFRQVYIVKDGLLYNSRLAKPNATDEEVKIRISGILQDIKQNKFYNPFTIYNLGNFEAMKSNPDSQINFETEFEKKMMDGYTLYFANAVTNTFGYTINDVDYQYINSDVNGIPGQSEGYEQAFIITPKGNLMQVQIDYIAGDNEAKISEEFSKLITRIENNNYENTDLAGESK